ncbi:MAG: phosphotransferase enzyme family protein [Porcipelethomonas sp.]
MDNLMNVTVKFGIDRYYASSERITSGHINDTYKITYSENEKYILQRVNKDVFSCPEKIMHNIKLLSNAVSDNDRIIIPEYLESGGKNYTVIDGYMWRMCPFIDKTAAFSRFDDEKLCFGFGEILGAFHKAAAKTDRSEIYESIPDFHNTPLIIEKLFSLGRPVMHSELFRRVSGYSEALLSSEKQQVVHNDAKCSNVLFYEDGRPAALIDLDTVMTGLAVYDIGDAVRSSCTENSEIIDERLRSFIRGYTASYGKINAESCVYAIICISAELAARYLYDFLSDGNYFRFKTGRMKLERSGELAALAENTESAAPRLIRLAQEI